VASGAANAGRLTERMHRARVRVRLLLGLVGAELAIARPETMKAAGRSFSVVRFVITDLGRATPRATAGVVARLLGLRHGDARLLVVAQGAQMKRYGRSANRARQTDFLCRGHSGSKLRHALQQHLGDFMSE
jgi:hypothetical protein